VPVFNGESSWITSVWAILLQSYLAGIVTCIQWQLAILVGRTTYERASLPLRLPHKCSTPFHSQWNSSHFVTSSVPRICSSPDKIRDVRAYYTRVFQLSGLQKRNMTHEPNQLVGAKLFLRSLSISQEIPCIFYRIWRGFKIHHIIACTPRPSNYVLWRSSESWVRVMQEVKGKVKLFL
jgi:hypothetical protein